MAVEGQVFFGGRGLWLLEKVIILRFWGGFVRIRVFGGNLALFGHVEHVGYLSLVCVYGFYII